MSGGIREYKGDRPINLLLADDDPAMTRVLAKWLNRAGYNVRLASDGYQALDMIESDCPDVLITDWNMPVINGLELCRRVRSMRLPHYMYIVFLTVKTDPREMIAGLDAGADDFLAKPVYEGELLARLKAGLRVLDLERKLSKMAKSDALTGLMTRRAFFERLEAEWGRAKRYKLQLSCAMLDIDFFKKVNDTLGHSAGDAVLVATANFLKSTCRSSDVISRFGGEEFCVMLTETTEAEAKIWAEHARRRLAAMVIPVGTVSTHITASFGIAERNDDVDDVEALVDHADQALLCAKQSGRDNIVCFNVLNTENEHASSRLSARGGLFRGVVARDVMRPLVAPLRDDETITRAIEFFLRSGVTSSAVVDSEGKLAGVITDNDLMWAMVSIDCLHNQIHKVMKSNVIQYQEDTPIQVVYDFLRRVSIRMVIIVDGNRPTGTISCASLLRWFSQRVLHVESRDFTEAFDAEATLSS